MKKRLSEFCKSKTAKRIAAAVMALALVATVAFAVSGTVMVKTSLNVRSDASTSSAIIGRLYNGSKIEVIDTVGDWYASSITARPVM